MTHCKYSSNCQALELRSKPAKSVRYAPLCGEFFGLTGLGAHGHMLCLAQKLKTWCELLVKKVSETQRSPGVRTVSYSNDACFSSGVKSFVQQACTEIYTVTL